MRALVGTLSLLVVLAIVGWLVNKQLTSPRVVASPAGISTTPQQQSQQPQQQFKQVVEGVMQQHRTMPEDKKE